MKNSRQMVLCGVAILLLFGPLMAGAAEWKAGDWTLSLGGTLRVSYNEEECDSACENIWRNADLDSVPEDQPSDYLSMNISQFAVSGSRMMDSGMNAVFKTEWRVDTPDNQNETTFHNYEQYIGVDAKWGLLRVGTIETPYMQIGALLDPFYSDALSSRFFVDIQSALHHNNGKGRGRSTNTLRYDSPLSKGGFTAQFFTGLDNSEDSDNSYGVGFIYTSKKMTWFAQYYNNGESGDDEAYKIGGKIGSGSFSVFGQYEFDKGLISLAENLSALGSEDENTAEGDNTYEDNHTTGADVWFLGASYKMGKIMLIYEYGERKDSDHGREKDDGHTGWVLGLSVHLDKYVYIYTGYLEKEFNDDRDKDTRYTVGATLRF